MALLAIFRKVQYFSIVFVTAVLAFFFIAIFSQIRLLADIVSDGGVTLSEKVRIIFAIPYGMFVEMTPSSLLTVAVAVLFGISAAGIVYYFRLYKATAVFAASAFSAGGVTSGIVALGCISCGSLVVGFLASFFSASSLLIFIPYQSAVFGGLAIAMLFLSLYILNKKLASV